MNSYTFLFVVAFFLVFFSLLLLGTRFLFRKLRKAPAVWSPVILLLAWLSLVVGGVLISGSILVLLSFPLAVVALAMFALLWRAPADPWGVPASVSYWLGVLATFVGAVHFGTIVWTLNAWATHFKPEKFLPPLPNVPVQLLVWCLPAVALTVGLKLGTVWSYGQIAMACALFLLLNPAILWLGTTLQFPMSL